MMDMKELPYGRQEITDEDIAEVVRVLKSDFLTQGPELELFEREFANYVGARRALAVANGTAALHLCALALKVRPGQKVITTPITFAASANCVRYCGGEVVFADIDPKSYCLSPESVSRLLETQPSGTFAGLIPVDFSGNPAELESFRELADQHGLWIIEDACHAPGASYTDSLGSRHSCGGGVHADLAIFSFHPVKHIACGEGGMITTNNDELYERLQLLRTHGITKRPELLSENHGPWYYEMVELGYNYRLTDFQAALGRSQLRRADKGLRRRRELAKQYDEAFSELGIVRQDRQPEKEPAFHLYVIEVDNRTGLYTHLQAQGIYAQVHYIPVHLQPYYRARGWKPGDQPLAEAYYDRCLSLPMYPSMSDSDQTRVIEAVTEFVHRG